MRSCIETKETVSSIDQRGRIEISGDIVWRGLNNFIHAKPELDAQMIDTVDTLYELIDAFNGGGLKINIVKWLEYKQELLTPPEEKLSNLMDKMLAIGIDEEELLSLYRGKTVAPQKQLRTQLESI